jgi:hypothetical protein
MGNREQGIGDGEQGMGNGKHPDYRHFTYLRRCLKSIVLLAIIGLSPLPPLKRGVKAPQVLGLSPLPPLKRGVKVPPSPLKKGG